MIAFEQRPPSAFAECRAIVESCIERGQRDHVVYFAHSRLAYGSPLALAARRLISTHRPGCSVLDPSRLDGDIWCMLVSRLGDHDAVYRLIISLCNEVVALEHINHVGRGVYCELTCAAQMGLPRYVVRNGTIVPILDVERVDPNDWRRRYGRIITTNEVVYGA